jgi:hypothetical protein
MVDYGFRSGQHVQVQVDGLLDLGSWQGKAAGVAAKIVEINPVTRMITVVLDQPIDGKHSLTVPISRVRGSN